MPELPESAPATFGGYQGDGGNMTFTFGGLEAEIARLRHRAEAAEAKLAEIEAHASAIVDALRHTLSYVEHVPHPSSQTAADRYRSALAIIGSEEGDRG